MKSSRSSLFLMELIISILFFSIASAACIQLFVKSHLLGQKTQEQNQAVIWSQNLSSLWLAADGDLNAVFCQLTEDFGTETASLSLSEDEACLRLCFDQNWNFCAADGNAYCVELSGNTYDASSQLIRAKIDFFCGEEVFYTLSLVHHPAAERGASYE